jgi:hypothetical protein
MRIAKNPNQASSVPEYLKSERLWLIPGKNAGKNCRPIPFLPVRRRAALVAPIQKQQRCQSLDSIRRVGTAFA